MKIKESKIHMADVSTKAFTLRRARARCEVWLKPATLAAIRSGRLPKGDVWAAAQVAGILAAKRTSELIPLCHPIPVSHVELRHTVKGRIFIIESEVTTTAPTGPEMEALTAAAIAALTVYDMCKSIEQGIEIRGLCLVEKSGGKSGVWRRSTK